MTSPSDTPYISLNDGRAIPQLGFGTYQIEPDQTERAVLDALEVSYRHIDTAQMYQNEAGVGRALAASGLNRDDVWVTTKLGNGVHERAAAREAVEKSLVALGEDYIDLLLVHWPLAMYGDVATVWETVEEIKGDYPVRSIGVSNFQPAHLDRIAEAGLTVPSVNQIEVNPYFLNDEVRGYDREHGIATEAWSPLAQGNVLDDPQLVALAEQVERTVSQVVIRWTLQRGDIVFPKSLRRERMQENLAVTDFELTDEQMASISALNRNERTGPDPDTFDWRS